MGRADLARGGCRIEKRRGDHWGIIAGVIVLIFASVLFGQSDTSKSRGAPSGSTYSSEQDGLSGIYEVLASQKLARRWESGLDRLPPTVSTLVLWQPGELDEATWQEIQAWVAAGHTLLVSASDPSLPGTVGPSSEGAARPVTVSPATLGVGEISVGPEVFTEVRGDRLTQVARTDGQAVLVSWKLGQGQIYWSADAGWLTNERIASADNLELALRLLTPAPGAQVAFDEYHHGFAAPERWWQLLRGPLQLFILQLAAVLAVFYWAYGVRFGAPQPLPIGSPRAAAEYVYSMSQLYRRARAGRMVLEALYRSLIRELGRSIGGTQGRNHQAVARAVAGQTGLEAGRVASLLDRTDPQRPLAPSDAELIGLCREVETIQRRVRNAGYRDQREAAADSK